MRRVVGHTGALSSPAISLGGAGQEGAARGFEYIGALNSGDVWERDTSAGANVSLPAGAQEGDLVAVAFTCASNSGLEPSFTQGQQPPETSLMVALGRGSDTSSLNLITSIVKSGQVDYQPIWVSGATTRQIGVVLRGPVRADVLTFTDSGTTSVPSLTPSDVPDGGLKNQLILGVGLAPFTLPPEYTLRAEGLSLFIATRDQAGVAGLQTQTGDIISASSQRMREMKAWMR